MKKVNVLLMVRVSKQTMDFTRQVDDLTRYAHSKNWEVVGVVSEKISGAVKNTDRKGIADIIEQAKGKKFEKLLVAELSWIFLSIVYHLFSSKVYHFFQSKKNLILIQSVPPVLMHSVPPILIQSVPPVLMQSVPPLI